MNEVLRVTFCVASPAAASAFWMLNVPRLRRSTSRYKDFLEIWMFSGFFSCLFALAQEGHRADAAGFGLSFVIALVLYLLHRRKDIKRALKAIGAKGRALLEKLVRSMPRPGPVLRPLPVPARSW